VSLASVGMPKRQFIEGNIELARTFKLMSAAERRRLTDSIAAERKVSLSLTFAHSNYLAGAARSGSEEGSRTERSTGFPASASGRRAYLKRPAPGR
jgi:hypothetical protein